MADNLPMWGQSGWANWRNGDSGPSLPLVNEYYKWNKIIRYLHLPCVPSNTVLLETLFPAALHALADFVEPDIKEAYKIKDGFRKGGTKKGRSLWKQIKGFAGEFEKTPAIKDGAKRTLFEFAELADRAVWWLFIIGLVTDFAYEWSTTAWEMAGCVQPWDFWFEGNASGPVWTITGPDQAGGTFWKGTGSDGSGYSSGYMNVPPGRVWYAYGTAQLTPWVAQAPANYRLAVVNNTTGETLDVGAWQDTSTQADNHSITMKVLQPARQFAQQVAIVFYTDHVGAWDAAVSSGKMGMGYTGVERYK